MDNRSVIAEEEKESGPEIKEFLNSEFTKIAEDKHKEEILSAHLDPHSTEEGYEILIETVEYISLLG